MSLLKGYKYRPSVITPNFRILFVFNEECEMLDDVLQFVASLRHKRNSSFVETHFW